MSLHGGEVGMVHPLPIKDSCLKAVKKGQSGCRKLSRSSYVCVLGRKESSSTTKPREGVVAGRNNTKEFVRM